MRNYQLVLGSHPNSLVAFLERAKANENVRAKKRELAEKGAQKPEKGVRPKKTLGMKFLLFDVGSFFVP